MAKYISFPICSLITILALVQGIQAVEYIVTNNVPTTPGGDRFNKELGQAYGLQTLVSATEFVWKVFQQNTPSERKNVPKITLIIDNYDGVAYTSNDEIHVGQNYVATYSGDLKGEISGVLYHETTHVWQWNGNGNAPGGLIEGIADFVRLKSGFVPSHWVSPGQGNRWDQGYDVTARFLDYLNELRNGVVAELNKKLKDGYDVNYFVELLGKNVDQLWTEYKAKYGN